MNNIGLDDSELKKINSIFVKYPEIEKVYLFGSRAKGNYRYNSDIDLAVDGNVSAIFTERIAEELDELPLPYKFDVQAYSKTLNTALKEHINRAGIVIFDKNAYIN